MTKPWVRAAIFSALATASLSACADKAQSERCAEMAVYLEGRTHALERDCTKDDDCQVVFIRPDSPIAARHQPGDPQLERVVFEFREACEPIHRATGTLDAVCIDRTIETVNPDDPTTTIPLSLGHTCVLRGTPILPDAGAPDMGIADARSDASLCACETSDDCASTERCSDCECIPAGPCADTCIAANACDALRDLGMGANLSVCSAACQATLEDRPESYLSYLQCIQAATCATIHECAATLP